MPAAVPQAREALLTGQLGLDDPTLFIQHGILNGKYVDAADGQTFTVDSESLHSLRCSSAPLTR